MRVWPRRPYPLGAIWDGTGVNVAVFSEHATKVEPLPIHFHIDEHFMIQQQRVSYWGYNSLGFFSPDPRYWHLSEAQLEQIEFVRRLIAIRKSQPAQTRRHFERHIPTIPLTTEKHGHVPPSRIGRLKPLHFDFSQFGSAGIHHRALCSVFNLNLERD